MTCLCYSATSSLSQTLQASVPPRKKENNSPILPSLIFRSQSICPNCKVFVKISNENDKIVVASLKCSDNDSCDCNNQRYCGRTSESQLGLVCQSNSLLCSQILTHRCVLIFRDIFPECRRKRGSEQQLSLSWLSSPLTLLLLPTQPEPPHSVTDCPSAGHQLTLSPSVQRQILRRDTFFRKHRDTRRRKRQKEKKRERAKRGGGGDM